MNKISIITVSYNSEKTIRDTIESVLNQTMPPAEYIIVDGMSTDNTLEIAESFTKSFKDKGIKYVVISEKDKGIYDAMNKGIRLASGDIIGMINSDDYYEKDTVDIALKSYVKNNYDAFFGDINMIRRDGKCYVKHSKIGRFPSSRHWNHPTMFVSKQIYLELGLYDIDGIYSDYDMYLRILKAQKKIVVENRVLANFRLGGISNKKNFNNSMSRLKERYNIYRKNGFSRVYLLECIFIELAKYLFG